MHIVCWIICLILWDIRDLPTGQHLLLIFLIGAWPYFYLINSSSSCDYRDVHRTIFQSTIRTDYFCLGMIAGVWLKWYTMVYIMPHVYVNLDEYASEHLTHRDGVKTLKLFSHCLPLYAPTPTIHTHPPTHPPAPLTHNCQWCRAFMCLLFSVSATRYWTKAVELLCFRDDMTPTWPHFQVHRRQISMQTQLKTRTFNAGGFAVNTCRLRVVYVQRNGHSWILKPDWLIPWMVQYLLILYMPGIDYKFNFDYHWIKFNRLIYWIIFVIMNYIKTEKCMRSV